MARYKDVDGGIKLLAVDLGRQLLPGTFEHALAHLIDQELDLSHFDAHYRCGATIRVRERDDQGERSDRGEAIMPVLIDAGKGHGCG